MPDNELTKYSQAPGNYLTDNSIRQHIVYPWAPGSSTSMNSYGIDPNFVSVENELNNLPRPLSKDPFKKYLPEIQSKVNPYDICEKRISEIISTTT